MNLTDEEIDNTIACWDPADGHTDKILLELHRYAVELKQARSLISDAVLMLELVDDWSIYEKMSGTRNENFHWNVKQFLRKAMMEQ